MRALAFVTSLLLLVALPAHAQVNTSTATADPTNPDSQTFNNERDSNFGNGGLNITNLIHRSNLAPSQTPGQARDAQSRSIDDAVSKFRSTSVRLTPQLLNPPQAGPTATEAPKP